MINDFLNQVKKNAEAKAKQLAALELSAWNDKHEAELIKYFGFNKQTVKQRKLELQKKISAR